jgi:uncharacterized membrane protein YfcA
VYDFSESKQIDYLLGLVLVITVAIGSASGSYFVAGGHGLSDKTIKYISGAVNVFLAVLFFVSGYYTKK